MNWKPIRNHFPAWCDMCHAPLPLDVDCYYRREEPNNKGRIICTNCHSAYGANADAQCSAPHNSTVITPTPISPSRDEQIKAAHLENMEANRELVMSIRLLTTAVNDRSALLKKNMEAKP